MYMGLPVQTESRALMSQDRLVLRRGSLLRIVFRVLNVLPVRVLGRERVCDERLGGDGTNLMKSASSELDALRGGVAGVFALPPAKAYVVPNSVASVAMAS
jgi:hypothetical protein